MDTGKLIKEWQEADCDVRIALIEYLQSMYGKNLANVLKSEDCKNV